MSSFIILVYLVLKRDKIVPNRCPFKSNLRVLKRQLHLAIFSLFENELEKSLNHTRLGVTKRHVMEEAKAPVLEFCKMSVFYE
jgi:hypothetical protein